MNAKSIAHTVGFNGGPIYGSQNTFGLSTNTIVLFAFVLAVAVVLSYAYIWAARAFTKQFIWITGRYCALRFVEQTLIVFSSQAFSTSSSVS